MGEMDDIVRNQVLEYSNHTALAATAQHLNLTTTELQESVMKTRIRR